MRQLRGHIDPFVEKRRQRTLPVQRLWAILQDERDQQASGQAQKAAGE